jgi:hypothetical protein
MNRKSLSVPVALQVTPQNPNYVHWDHGYLNDVGVYMIDQLCRCASIKEYIRLHRPKREFLKNSGLYSPYGTLNQGVLRFSDLSLQH